MSYHPFVFKTGDEVLYITNASCRIRKVIEEDSGSEHYPVHVGDREMDDNSFTRNGAFFTSDFLPSIVVIADEDKERIKALDITSTKGMAEAVKYVMDMAIKYKWEPIK